MQDALISFHGFIKGPARQSCTILAGLLALWLETVTRQQGAALRRSSGPQSCSEGGRVLGASPGPLSEPLKQMQACVDPN